MRPKSFTVNLYRIPSRREQRNALETFTEYEYAVVRIDFDNGIEGIGWTYTQGRGGTAVLHLLRDYYGPALINEGISSPDELNRKASSLTYSYGLEGVSRIALSALDLALWDALSKGADYPLYLMLGGKRGSKVRAYRSEIDLNYTVEELRAECSAFREAGFTAFKIKVGKESVEEDVRRIRAVRDVIGEGSELMVDANRKWSLKEALRRGRKFQEEGVYWLEEPVEAEALEDYKVLRRSLDLRIAAGETVYNRLHALRLINEGCVDVVQFDVLRVGGITEWLKLAHTAELQGLPVAPHFGEEIAVQTLNAVPNALFLEHLRNSNLHDSGVLSSSYRLEGGFAYPPEAPGHGIQFNWEALYKYRVA
jgi:L-alanine-DL-glutamate epimerase-like enolase superfamily enzyme